MHVLAVTFDISGNLPPLVGLSEALVASGHRVTVLAHRSQQPALEAVGAQVLSFARAPERNAASPDDRLSLATLNAFDRDAVADVAEAISATVPDVLVVDGMLPVTLREIKDHGVPVVALVHSAWYVFDSFLDGHFRGPIEGSDLAIISSYRDFDDDDVAPAHCVWVGPLRANPGTREWRWPRTDHPRVLASLSTGQQGQEATLRSDCAALSDGPWEALVTVGRAFDPAQLSVAPNVSLERLVPHEHVLNDVRLLVTHGGHGTAMIGLRSGVPMLFLPGVGDQPIVAKRISAMGVAETLDATASVEEIHASIARLLHDDAMLERSRALARAIEGHPGAELAVARIEALAAGV